MNKIALEITSEGWEITVIIDGKEYIGNDNSL